MEWDLRAEEVKAQEWAERLECLRLQIEYWISTAPTRPWK
jgi:hypothetical protein